MLAVTLRDGASPTPSDWCVVVTLCGSMRFAAEMERLEAELTLAGHVVLAPTPVDRSSALTADDLTLLGRVHLQKVAMADEVLVVDPGGHVGDSTRREVAHARSLGIPVTYLEPPTDADPAGGAPGG